MAPKTISLFSDFIFLLICGGFGEDFGGVLEALGSFFGVILGGFGGSFLVATTATDSDLVFAKA